MQFLTRRKKVWFRSSQTGVDCKSIRRLTRYATGLRHTVKHTGLTTVNSRWEKKSTSAFYFGASREQMPKCSLSRQKPDSSGR